MSSECCPRAVNQERTKMGDDQIAEYELACLLEEIEKAARYDFAADAQRKIRTLFDRARMNQIVRYPQP